MKSRKQGMFLLILCLQSLIAFLLIFLMPSEKGSHLVLWFSKSRLILVVGFLLLFVAQCAASLYLFRRPQILAGLAIRLKKVLITKKLLLPLLIMKSVSLILGIFYLGIIITTPLDYEIYRNLAPTTFPMIKSIGTILSPVIFSGLLLLFESILLLLIHFRADLRKKELWNQIPLAPLGLFFIFLFTIFQWLVLILKLRVFSMHPTWYWAVTDGNISFRDGIFALFILGLLILCVWLFKKKRTWLGVGCLLVLGFCTQFTPAILSTAGLSAFQDRYFTTYHSIYPGIASQSKYTNLETIRNYEKNYGTSKFTETKPPGLLVIYQTLDRLINGSPTRSEKSPEERLANTKQIMTFLFPCFALGMIGFMVFFSRKYLLQKNPDILPNSILLVILAPNFILFSLFADQAIYPGMFLIGLWIIIVFFGKQSILLGFCLGVILYLFTFFAFTMLPLYPIAAIFLFLLFWQSPKIYPFVKQLKLGVSFLCGFAASYFAAKFLLNYDMATRFQHMITINHNADFYKRVGLQPPGTVESLGVRLQQIAGAAWINQIEFSTAIGMGVYLVFLIGAVRLIVKVSKRKSDSSDIILASLLFSFVLINLMGTAQGEVARLWLFWLPMVAWIVVQELQTWRIPHQWVYIGLCAAQLVTTLLTFHFQDFHM